jgi:ankyrin repeat protein
MDEDKPPTARDGEAETPLHAAAWAGNVDRAKQLVAQGADVNHIDTAGETPLHGASSWGQTDMVSFLIEHGARIDFPESADMTPLHWAAGWGNLETVKTLVARSVRFIEGNQHSGATVGNVALGNRRSVSTVGYTY